MLEALKKFKTAIVTIVLLAAAFFAYSYLFLGDKVDETLLSTAGIEQTEASRVGQELLILIAELRALNIDRSVVEHPLFTWLQDATVVPTSEPVGRRNPFAPLVPGEAGTEGTAEPTLRTAPSI